MTKRNPLLIYIPVLLAMIFWSYSFIWYKQVFVNFQPMTVIVLRLVIAVPLLFGLSVMAGKLQRIQKRHLKWFLLLGFFEPFLYFMGECYGMNLISPTLGSIIISLIPLMVPIPARYIFRERFSFINYVGLVISITGVLLVIAGDKGSRPGAFAGVLLMLLAVLAAVCHSVYVRKLSEYYSSFTIVTYQSTFGFLYFIPVFMFTEFHHFIIQPHSFILYLPVIKLAVFSSTLAFLLFVYSIKNLGMARTNVFINLIPVFTAILSYFILKECFGLIKIAGILVVITGIVFSQYSHSLRSSRTIRY
jgi:drug/metabolite transporter (DMT)-like permease